MGNWWLCLSLLLLCLPWVVGEEELPPLSVKFIQSGILYSQEHGHLTLHCDINRNQLFCLENNIFITRKSVIEGTEANVSHYPTNLNMDGNYTVSLQPVEGNGILINISISKVRDLDEGTFICRLQNSSGITLAEDDVQIELKKPLQNVYLEFNGSSPISKAIEEPFEVFAGSYSVICIANGSNPEPNVSLFLNGHEVKNVDKQTELLATKLKEYKTKISASIPITFSTSVQVIICNGTTQLEDEHSVPIYVKTKIRDPDINCSETKAQKGQKHPVLICTVQFEGVNITNFTYADGAHTVEFRFHNVDTENSSGTEKRVSLTLDEAEDWHFQDFYLLLTHADGHITRESVKLHDSAGQSNSSASVQFLLVTLFVSFISWLIL